MPPRKTMNAAALQVMGLLVYYQPILYKTVETGL
jgi:hypothetical protein